MSDKVLENLKREDLHLASIEKRMIAFMIDDMLISIIFLIIFYQKIILLINDYEQMVIFINSIFVYIVSVKIAYQTIFVYLYGQTVGKMAMKIRIVNKFTFDNPTFLESLNRAVARVVSEIFFYLGFIWANYNPLRESWHDKFAKTIVIDD
jgi:uncharacterized RDD family membrane protein YckC